MATLDFTGDHLPAKPRYTVRLAETPEENAQALAAITLWNATKNPLEADDATLLALLEEPEMYATLDPIARELVVRLGAANEIILRMDEQAPH